MTEDTNCQFWHIYTGIDILITTFPVPCIEKPIKKPFWLEHYDHTQRTKITCLFTLFSHRKQIRIWCSFNPLGSSRWSQTKWNGKVLKKKKKRRALSFLWHLPKKTPKSETVTELSPHNMNIHLTVSNLYTWIPITAMIPLFLPTPSWRNVTDFHWLEQKQVHLNPYSTWQVNYTV